jgi:ribonucleoside-diphosphate reductase alpha chain
LREIDQTEREQRQQVYEAALAKHQAAGKELEEALRSLHSAGIYPGPPEGIRFGLPDERQGLTHKIGLGSPPERVEGYATSGIYTDGKIGELFIVVEKEGSFASGLLDAFATVFSVAIQYGVPPKRLIEKLRHTRFEPAGYTQNAEIRNASSILDYIMQWLDLRYTDQPEEDKDGDVSTPE